MESISERKRKWGEEEPFPFIHSLSLEEESSTPQHEQESEPSKDEQSAPHDRLPKYRTKHHAKIEEREHQRREAQRQRDAYAQRNKGICVEVSPKSIESITRNFSFPVEFYINTSTRIDERLFGKFVLLEYKMGLPAFSTSGPKLFVYTGDKRDLARPLDVPINFFGKWKGLINLEGRIEAKNGRTLIKKQLLGLTSTSPEWEGLEFIVNDSDFCPLEYVQRLAGINHFLSATDTGSVRAVKNIGSASDREEVLKIMDEIKTPVKGYIMRDGNSHRFNNPKSILLFKSRERKRESVGNNNNNNVKSVPKKV